MSDGAEPFIKSVEVDWSHVSDADGIRSRSGGQELASSS